MKLLVVGCDSYYYAGASYERGQIAASLEALGHNVRFVPVHIHQTATERVDATIKEFQPGLCLFIPHMHEVDPGVFHGYPVVLLLADDDWRRGFGLQIAQNCDYVMANAPDSMLAYGAKSIPFEWAVYPPLFAGDDCERIYEVGFIAQNYGNRQEYIDALNGVDINTLVRGMGFPGGGVSPETMAALLRQCKIGLNLSKTSQGDKRQVKIRPFEIGAAGAMILTEYAPGIENSFIDGKEAIFFETLDEMVEAALYYLTHDSKREAIAAAGYARVMRDHTLARRWEVMFRAVGLA